MDDGLKQRIIGAIVLLALAVIFIPILFDKERIEPVDTTTQIPIAPPQPLTTIEPQFEKNRDSGAEQEPKEPVSIAPDIQHAKDSFSLTQDKLDNDQPQAISLGDDGLPNAWVLQVASFLHIESAKKFRDKLIEKNFTAFEQEVKTDKGVRFRVYVGPKVSKPRLLEDKARIKREFDTEALVLKFQR